MDKISVVIPAFNAEKTISQLLSNLARQTYVGEYEVIIVNNESTDSTLNILNDISGGYPVELIVLHVPQGVTIGAVRNYGVSQSQGNILAFIDSDCVPPLNWLEYGVELLKQNKKQVLLAGSCKPPQSGTWVETAWYSTRAGHKNSSHFVHGANFFIPKSLFLEVGGFRENIQTSEDYDLGRRVANDYHVVTAPGLEVTHYGEANTLIKKFAKERWYSRNMFDSVRGNILYKPFWLSLTFLIVNVFCIQAMIFKSAYYAFCLVLINILMVFFLAIYFCQRANDFKYFVQLLPISYAYLLGRSVGILDNTFHVIFEKYIKIVK